MRRCAEAGYPVRAVFMPLIPINGWRVAYGGFVKEPVEAVPLERLKWAAFAATTTPYD